MNTNHLSRAALITALCLHTNAAVADVRPVARFECRGIDNLTRQRWLQLRWSGHCGAPDQSSDERRSTPDRDDRRDAPQRDEPQEPEPQEPQGCGVVG